MTEERLQCDDSLAAKLEDMESGDLVTDGGVDHDDGANERGSR